MQIVRDGAGHDPEILHQTSKKVAFLNRKPSQTAFLYVCVIALLAVSTVQAIHVCNLGRAAVSVSSQDGEPFGTASTVCPICFALHSATVALISITVFSPSLRREFSVIFQPFHFIEPPVSFQFSVRPPPFSC